MVFFGYLIAMILMTLVIGQKLALPLFVAVYLIRWGRYNWRTALGYAAVGWLVLIVFYDRIMDLFWHPSWLNSWLPQLLPDWLPAWLFF
jgi:putative tricarboxylic transport membrane protein